jgi:hypothetical protein
MRIDRLDLSGAKLSLSLIPIFCFDTPEVLAISHSMNGGVGKTKFKILPKVSGFTDAAGVQHLPGEIVDLPESYRGETWLKIVEEPKRNPTPVAEIDEAERPEKPAEIRLERKKTKRKTK